MASSLFSDLLVIDCASYIAGPAAATILSDFGARVIKIEPPIYGDAYRNLVRMKDPTGSTPDYYWTMDGRNKESLAIDLKQDAARAVLDKLIDRADVFITNYPFHVREKLGIDAETLTARNRQLIYASMTPYGEQGDERDRTAFDSTAWWARSGLMAMVKDTEDTPYAPPMPGMGDHPTAVSMYAAIVTALVRRERIGKGGVVSTSLLANGLWANSCQVQAALCDVELVAREPRYARSPLSDTYRCADGKELLIVVNSNVTREWPRLAPALGHPEWLDDPRFNTSASRLENAALLAVMMEEIFASEPFAVWSERLTKAGVTFSFVARTSDHDTDPQIAANGLLPDFIDGGGLKTVDSPFVIAGEQKHAPRMAPAVGQHTRAILQELGLSAAEIAALES
ncbi:MAG: CoA transferase [Caulobacterales bacterium]